MFRVELIINYNCNLYVFSWTQSVDKWPSNFISFIDRCREKREPISKATEIVIIERVSSFENNKNSFSVQQIGGNNRNRGRNNGAWFRWCDERECALVFTFFMLNLSIFHFHRRVLWAIGEKKEEEKTDARTKTAAGTFGCAPKTNLFERIQWHIANTEKRTNLS